MGYKPDLVYGGVDTICLLDVTTAADLILPAATAAARPSLHGRQVGKVVGSWARAPADPRCCAFCARPGRSDLQLTPGQNMDVQMAKG
ncbi:hypothetical protein SORBI_3004G240250 [Sorghum bicolor]|uniref:Uncharacterized protein n=1 Tax=Sorghum bicolor TaxID=4558 RepID=A0A1Z5RPB4_SORBI|nr:hypothetical protein SORBI_3004G240250 [Sorghum bicolor]